MILTHIWKWLDRMAPSVTGLIRSLRNRRRLRSQFSEEQAECRRLLFEGGRAIRVMSGPFEGMNYFDEIVWGPITPKWLGCYEAELHDIVGEIIRNRYTTVIDVGCAEGYYAVGLAFSMPDTTIHAFDVDFISRRQTRRLAGLNDLDDRVQVGGFCRHEDIDALADSSTLVVCDIEGFESELLDPGKAPALRSCDVLVELHDRLDGESGTTAEVIRARFEPSHTIQVVKVGDRSAWIKGNKRIFPDGISPHEINKAVCEYRDPNQEWMWLKSRSRPLDADPACDSESNR